MLGSRKSRTSIFQAVVDTHGEFDDATGVFTASRRCLVLAVAAVGVGAASTSSSPAYALVLCKHDATDAVVDYAGGEVFERMYPDTVTTGFGLRAEGMFYLEPGEKVSAKVHLMHGTATALRLVEVECTRAQVRVDGHLAPRHRV
jgi:hypothetical protein